ncbi:MAG: hypothetical protein D3909_11045 [Candidatus Electrothrix sp. ATG1]|nr:hypothetical protein [Candidatus Electrothrix sp. ATG1]MCI5208198.1 hypothetical protein [Candidatus Electrothrix sp. ATG2]
MSDLIWLIFIFLVAALVVSVLWLIWRLRHFSQTHNNQTVLDDKLMQNMLGDEALSKDLKKALVDKKSTGSTGGAEDTTVGEYPKMEK